LSRGRNVFFDTRPTLAVLIPLSEDTESKGGDQYQGAMEPIARVVSDGGAVIQMGGITMHRLRKLRESGKPTPAQVSELLAENVVFNSPLLVRPIEGRDVCAAIFAQSSSTRGSGAYVTESKLDERTTFLRWVGTMDGHKFESLEVIVDNEQGLIVERTIALRPYPALKLFRDAMYESLKDKLPTDVWDYPKS
jgi:hypothetical protein